MDTEYGVAIPRDPKKPVLSNAATLLVAAGGLLLTHPAEAKGPEKVLYSFCSQKKCSDGATPAGGLLTDKAGNFYGVTAQGGANRAGAVFKLAPDGSETVLYSFCSLNNCSDGNNPNVVTPIEDSAGNLFGTTNYGGSAGCDCGVVWKLSPGNNGKWTESVLHTFTGGSDGGDPFSGLVTDASGNLYGTAASGGKGDCIENQITLTGCGTVFEIATDGTFSTLYHFKGGSDGANPNAKLILDNNGNLFGTTLAGGTGVCNIVGTSGCGTVFELASAMGERKAWNKTILYSFTGGSDGANPVDFGGLLLIGSTIYGTTYDGGASNSGTVFALTTDGAESVLYPFTGGIDGGNPWGGLIADANINLYGTAQTGGTGYSGAVFEVATGGSESVLYSFCLQKNCKDGSGPIGELIPDSKFQHVIGTAAGGAHNGGMVYSVQVPK